MNRWHAHGRRSSGIWILGGRGTSFGSGGTGPGCQGLAVGPGSYSCPQPVRLSVCIEHGGSGGHLIRVQVTSADSIDSEWTVSRLRHEVPDAQRNSCRADSIARAAQGGDTSDAEGCTRAHADLIPHGVPCDESVELDRIVGVGNRVMECALLDSVATSPSSGDRSINVRRRAGRCLISPEQACAPLVSALRMRLDSYEQPRM